MQILSANRRKLPVAACAFTLAACTSSDIVRNGTQSMLHRRSKGGKNAGDGDAQRTVGLTGAL